MSFNIPCCVAYAGKDSFINNSGEQGEIELDIDTLLPFATCGSIKAYFIPLVIGA